MFRALLVVAAVSGCARNGVHYPGERTLWEACWTPDGKLDLPSDSPPHSPKCKSWEHVRWDHHPVTVQLADDAEVDESKDVIAAIAVWNAALGFEMFRWSPARDGRADVIVHTTAAPVAIVSGGSIYVLAGIAIHRRDAQKTIVCDVGIFGRPGLATVVHELGHVLGLAHDDDGRSVMTSGGDHDPERIEISKADVDALKRLYRKLA